MKIGLALSGGGMRAAVFHLGVLRCLAEHGLFEQIAHISSVSGASICMGLIYGCHDHRWPDDVSFLQEVYPKIKTMITQKDIQWHSLARLLIEPYYWDKKVNLLANVMKQRWNVEGCLQDIPVYPRWTINTTAYESGKDFRISSEQMGSIQTGYVSKPSFPLTHAMAASAGFPILIGPYKLKTKDKSWVNQKKEPIQPQDKVLHLWDGGVYDNMGLDPLFHIGNHTSLHKDINYLIVSNASGTIAHKNRTMSFSIGNLKRLLDISMDQVESLKSRSVIAYVQKYHNGLYLKIGSEVKDILHHCELPYHEKEKLLLASLNKKEVDKVKDYKTTLEKMSVIDFDKIARHGYELAQCQLYCFGNLE